MLMVSSLGLSSSAASARVCIAAVLPLEHCWLGSVVAARLADAGVATETVVGSSLRKGEKRKKFFSICSLSLFVFSQ
jgi:hypothetical protein